MLVLAGNNNITCGSFEIPVVMRDLSLLFVYYSIFNCIGAKCEWCERKLCLPIIKIGTVDLYQTIFLRILKRTYNVRKQFRRIIVVFVIDKSAEYLMETKY